MWPNAHGQMPFRRAFRIQATTKRNTIRVLISPPRARSSVGLERVPPEHKVRGSSPFGRAISLGFGPESPGFSCSCRAILDSAQAAGCVHTPLAALGGDDRQVIMLFSGAETADFVDERAQ